MSREPRGLPRGAGGLVATPAGAPYQKNAPHSSATVVAEASRAHAAAAAASAAPHAARDDRDYPYIDAHTLHRMPRRVKPLPPDRNDAAVGALQLLQFEEHVQFRCGRCKKDRIIADCLAADPQTGATQCVRCFTRLIRPKQFRPSRVVPFPSLLSWLNYRPQDVMAANGDEDVTQRAADIVAPSGHRVATESVVVPNLMAITESAMNPAGSLLEKRSRDLLRAAGVDVAPRAGATHPCLRVWGSCAHGDAMCMFVNAPGNLCVAFLMGLCAHGDECPLLHQRVLDLPDSIGSDLPPPPRFANAEHPSAHLFKDWVARRQNSRNGAEWQLYNNGPLDGLFNQYLPAPIADEQVAAPQAAQPETSAPVKLSLAAITGALGRLKKPAA